jgi:hypothetical protein
MIGSCIRSLMVILAATALVLAGVGCQAQPAQWSDLGDHSQDEIMSHGRRVNVRGLHVVPASGRYIVQLRATDVIRILKSIGCTNEQVLEIGPDFRDALAERGTAHIMMGRVTEATVQVGNGQVLISSVTRGMFIYDLRRAQIGLPNVAPGLSMQGRMGR